MTAEMKFRILIEEGEKIPFNFNQKSFKEIKNLPEWFDSEKIKRGQKFIEDNIFPVLFSQYLGLIFTMCVNNLLEKLIFTGKSDTPEKAYKRYGSTLLHIMVWYQNDFQPDSKLWKSLEKISKIHNLSSKSFEKNGLSFITQKDMVLTQFAFIGILILVPEKVGVRKISNENLDCIMHIWRTIGHILGIEDRFNLCSGTVEENKKFCLIILEKFLMPRFLKIDENYLKMANAAVEGFKNFAFLDFEATILHLKGISKEDNIISNEKKMSGVFENLELKTFRSKFIYFLLKYFVYLYDNFGSFLNWYAWSSIKFNKYRLTLPSKKLNKNYDFQFERSNFSNEIWKLCLILTLLLASFIIVL